MFCHFGPFFAPLPANDPENQDFEKIKKILGGIIILQNCTKNHDHILHCSWDTKHDRCYFYFSFWPIFIYLLFYPPNDPKNQNFLKIKKRHLETSSFTYVYQKSQSYDVRFLRYRVRQPVFFVFLGHFLIFNPPNDPVNQSFKKMKKIPRDIIILHMCTINGNHVMYGSWDIEPDRQKFLSVWIVFCPFTRYGPRKWKYWKH